MTRKLQGRAHEQIEHLHAVVEDEAVGRHLARRKLVPGDGGPWWGVAVALALGR